VWRLHNLAGTGDRVVVASSNGTLSASTSVTGLVDTTTISTRAWRQKGDDSLGAIIATKGSGTVTSVATGYGLSGGTITTTGTLLVDTLNIATRAWRQKGLDSLAALEVSGSGTTNYVPKFTGASTLGNSIAYDNGSEFLINTTNDNGNYPLQVSGNVYTTAGLALAVTSGNIGVGTVSPQNDAGYKSITINGTSGGQIGFYAGGFQQTNMYGDATGLTFVTTAATPMSFLTNSLTRMTIESGGDVGIGVVNATEKLDVNGRMRVRTIDSTETAINMLYADATGVIKKAPVPTGTISGSGTTNYVPKFTAASTIGNSQIFDNGTNVGVGTASPSVKLDVAGSGVIGRYTSTSNAVPISIYNTGTSISTIGFKGSTSTNDFNVRVGADANDYIAYTNNTERLRIFANGRIGVNTTTDAGYQFDINGTLRSVNGANFATTSGNVGIGTASPTHKLHIVQNATAGRLDMTNIDRTSSALVRITNPEYSINASSGILLRVFPESDARQGAGIIASGGGNNGETNLDLFVSQGTTSSTSFSAMRIAGNNGNVGIGTTNPLSKLNVHQSGSTFGDGITMSLSGATRGTNFLDSVTNTYNFTRGGASGTGLALNSSSEVLINTTTDAGDYKLQVVGNARVGTGKLDISSNTAFSMNVQRSGTSEVAGTFNNSNGILYLGAESSAGGAIFTGSSAYAAVIGSGAAYPLQFATNNVTRATINTNGELLINTTTDNGDFKLQVNGNALISGSIKTANGASSTAQPWHLGSVVATNVQLDTANYVEVEINGVFYRLAIVTPL
jgi:hypothetical protein